MRAEGYEPHRRRCEISLPFVRRTRYAAKRFDADRSPRGDAAYGQIRTRGNRYAARSARDKQFSADVRAQRAALADAAARNQGQVSARGHGGGCRNRRKQSAFKR